MSDFWDSAKGVLGTVAPVLATAVGGPLAGVATKAIVSALGLTGDTTPEAAALAVANATPDQLLALKKADQDFAAKMKELDIDLLKVDADDRASARQREIAVKDWMPRALGLGVVAAFLTASFLILAGKAPGAADPAVSLTAGAIVGYLANECKAVMAYYFGSSAGSSKKDETINALSK